MRDLEQKSLTITGGGSGMGRATALLAARMGAQITLSDINEAGGQNVVAEIRAAGGTAQFIRVDVGSEADVQGMVNLAVKTYGKVDCGFNNAGLPNTGKPIHEISSEEMERVWSVNVRGVFYCMKYQISAMLGTGGGAIVNMGSACSHVVIPDGPDYVSSKHAVLGLTRSAAIDYATKGIRINAVLPGTVHTPMLDGLFASSPESKEFLESQTPIRRLGQPNEIAEAVVWLLSDKASYVTGTGFSVDGGYTAV